MAVSISLKLLKKMDRVEESLSFPSICIPFSKTHYGAQDEYEVTETFVKECFKRYGDISRVIMKRHTTAAGSGEAYYSITIHFHSWDIENKEAKYVRSVLMLPDENSNVKLVYHGPWYWKFFAHKPRYIKL
jgi:hypothetical protein